MQWLLAGGEVLTGLVVLVGWWFALKFFGRHRDKPLTNMRFVVLPSILLLWGVGGIVLVLQGLRLI
jgi:hypothetical protein